MRGEEALTLARQFLPTAVSLDVFLPDMLGWTVLSQLKQDPRTRHIPVQIVTLDEDRQHGLARGAFSFVTKPSSAEGSGRRAGSHQVVCALRAASGCSSSRTTSPSSSASANCSAHDDIDIIAAESGEQALTMLGMEDVRLRRARPAAARHVRLRRARTARR